MFRTSAFVVIVAAALVATLGYVLPAHRVGSDAHFHSNFADGGPLPLLVLGAAAAIVFALRKMRLGGGSIAGVVGAAGAIFGVAPVILSHFLSRVENTYGEHVFAVGILALFFASVILFVAEPILYLLERKSRERTLRPAPLPSAVASYQS